MAEHRGPITLITDLSKKSNRWKALAFAWRSTAVSGIDACSVCGAPALSIERGRGTELWDTDGNRYLDFLSGIAVTSLGHANPVVAEAISRQASTLLHVSNFFSNPQATAAAEARSPPRLWRRRWPRCAPRPRRW